LVDLFEYMMMHGLTNPKFIYAKQASDTYAYRNIKRKMYKTVAATWFNTLNPELNPICYLLALLGAHHFLHVSRKSVKLLTLRRLMSYMYMEHPFLMFLDHTQ